MSNQPQVPREIKAARPVSTQIIHLINPADLSQIEELFIEYDRAPLPFQPFFKIRIELAVRQREFLAASKERYIKLLLKDAEDQNSLVADQNKTLRERLRDIICESPLAVQIQEEVEAPTSIGTPHPDGLSCSSPISAIAQTHPQDIVPVHLHTLVDGDDPDKAAFSNLFNCLTSQNFDQIAFRTLQLVNSSGKEKNGHGLFVLVQAIFETAIESAQAEISTFHRRETFIIKEGSQGLDVDDLSHSSKPTHPLDAPNKLRIFANLCTYLIKRIDRDIQVEGVRRDDGGKLSGGPLFHKLILNLCQINSKWYEFTHYPQDGNFQSRKLAIIRFTGELFLEGFVKHEAIGGRIKHLINTTKGVNEQRVECLCALLETVGSRLDSGKMRKYMNRWVSELEGLSIKEELSLTLRLRLKELIRLRLRNWGVGTQHHNEAA